MTFLRDYFPQTLRIEALAHFPIERDLVIVMDDFMAKLDSIKPYIIREQPRTLAEGEYLQTPAQLDLYQQFSHCINCLLCYAACPQYGLNSKFIGPGAMALVHRYNLDSRDQGKAQRLPLVQSEEGVFNCTAVGYCSEVCPKHVDPANAVNVNKTEAAQDYFLRFVAPAASGGGK
jgi:fumarate reductase iron-sulfur subunit